MKGSLLATLMWALLVTVPLDLRNHDRLSAASQPRQSGTPTAVDTDRIVSAFTAKETEFRNALAQYSFKRDAVAQTIGAGGQISGEYRRTSLLTFDSSGKRIEKILFFPPPTLSSLDPEPDTSIQAGRTRVRFGRS